jgi:hypothetical protein
MYMQAGGSTPEYSSAVAAPHGVLDVMMLL